VKYGHTRFPVASEQLLASRFLVTAREGDIAAVLSLLYEDVVVIGNGGGVVLAATKPIHGAHAVALLRRPSSARDGAITLTDADEQHCAEQLDVGPAGLGLKLGGPAERPTELGVLRPDLPKAAYTQLVRSLHWRSLLI
jgi:hypothetical protein